MAFQEKVNVSGLANKERKGQGSKQAFALFQTRTLELKHREIKLCVLFSIWIEKQKREARSLIAMAVPLLSHFL